MQKFVSRWLECITTPSLPMLGPVHPDVISVGLLDDILASLKTGERPPYDKGRRWGELHDERLLQTLATQNYVAIITKSGAS